MPFWKKSSPAPDEFMPVPDTEDGATGSLSFDEPPVPPELDGVTIYEPDAPAPSGRRKLPLVLLGVLGGLVVLGGGAFYMSRTGALARLGRGTNPADSLASRALRDSVAGLLAQGGSSSPSPIVPATPPAATDSAAMPLASPLPTASPSAESLGQTTPPPSSPGATGASAALPSAPPLVTSTQAAPLPDSAALARAAVEAAKRQADIQVQAVASAAVQKADARADSIRQARAQRAESARLAREEKQRKADSVKVARRARADSVKAARQAAANAGATAAPIAPQATPAAPAVVGGSPSPVVAPTPARPRIRPENRAWDDPRAPWNKKKQPSASGSAS